MLLMMIKRCVVSPVSILTAPAGDAVWLLELSGVDQETLHEYSSGPVLVEGILRRLPEGPRQGLLEVRSLERAR
jgi:hypothetical protein